MAAPDQAGQSAVLSAGSFYGAVQAKKEQCGAIFTDLRHNSPRKLPSHAHELPFFGLILGGQYGERYGRQNAQFLPFTMMFRPAGVPHQDEIGPHGVQIFEIELRPSWQHSVKTASGSLDFARDSFAGEPPVWLGFELYRKIQAGTADELEIESLLSELVAGVGRVPAEERKARPNWLDRIVDKIHAEFPWRLTLDELSEEADVHPVHLSRTFRKWQGVGIGEYVHRLRIRTACEQILNPEIPLAEIGFASGFADQSHFTRSFRKFTGMTPAAFRLHVAGGSQPLQVT
jgi:AraC family transcriptional regulator